MILGRSGLIAAFLAMVFTVACARIDFAVRFADLYLMHEADRLIDLTSEQKKDLKPEIKNVLIEIRRQDFPKIAEVIDQIAAHLEKKGCAAADVMTWMGEGDRIFHGALARFEPAVLAIARKWTTSQDETLAKALRQDNAKNLAEVATPDKARSMNRKRILKWTDNLMGSLTTAQDKALDQFATEHPYPTELQVKSKEHILDEYLRTPKNKRETWLKALLKDPDSHHLPEYTKARNDWRNGLRDYVVSFWSSLSPEQKKSLLAGLRKKSEDFRRLSKTE